MRRPLFVCLLAVLTASCHRPQPPSPPSGHFIPFDQFLGEARNSQFTDYATRPGAKVRDAAAFEEMRQHILAMYDGARVVSSFTVEGAYVDCLTTDTQPSVRLQHIARIETPPPSSGTAAFEQGHAPGRLRPAPSLLREGLRDAFGHPVSCAAGTIPMARLTLEKLVRYQTLLFFFSKDGEGGGRIPTRPREPEAPETGSVVHKYAHASQDVKNFGGNSWLNLWSPKVADSARMSLSQQWYVGGSGSKTQTVEGGWQVAEDHYDTKKAALFIYWTADDYDDTGCYNLECSGFVQTNNNWYLGGPWNHYSSSGGTQWGFELQWKYFHGNWWMFLRGPGSYEAVGYYPGSIYGNGQLAHSAESIDYGGEATGKSSWPEMGSGQFADKGWRKAAFQNTIFLIPRDEDGGVGVWADLSKSEPSPKCYTIDLVPASRGGDWGTYFYFGGPGGKTCE